MIKIRAILGNQDKNNNINELESGPDEMRTRKARKLIKTIALIAKELCSPSISVVEVDQPTYGNV